MLYEGSGDYTETTSKRAPCFLEELTSDEQDLVTLQLDQHQKGQSSATTQTDCVGIIRTDDVLPPTTAEAFGSIMRTLKDPQEKKTATKTFMATLEQDMKDL